MIDDIHYLHGVALPSGGFISELVDLTPQNNHTVLQGMSAGHPQPLFRAIMGAKPEIQFQTHQLRTLLDALGVFGLDTSTGNTDFFFRRGKNLGSRQANAGGNHKRIRATHGLMYWLSLAADYQQAAVARVRYKPISSDGQTAPYVPLGGLSLTDDPVASEFYTLGPIKINGTALQGVKRAELMLNPTMTEEGAGDDLYDTYAGHGDSNPTLMLDGLSWSAWTSYGLTGAALTSWEFYLRRKENDKHHYANASAQHIKISGSYGIAVVPQSQAAGNVASRTGVELHLRATDSQEGTNWCTIQTALAIT